MRPLNVLVLYVEGPRGKPSGRRLVAADAFMSNGGVRFPRHDGHTFAIRLDSR